MHDAVAALSRGKTAVAVTTAEFTALARTMAANAGRPGLRVLTLPYPLDTRPEPEVRHVAREHRRPLLRALGVPGRLAEQSSTGG